MLKVVVIDGNAISRNLLTSVLVNGGFDVIGDANASTASLAAMIKLQPQIVCIDIGSSDDEGFNKLATLQASLPRSLYFLVSGQFDAATVQTASARGVHGFIVKPFNAVSVIATIRKAIIKIARLHQQRAAGDNAT